MFVKFFSSVQGRVVHRLGSGTLIGASETADGFKWDEKQIVPISDAEWLRCSRAYEKHVKAGDLRERKEEEYKAFMADAAKAEESAAAGGTKKKAKGD